MKHSSSLIALLFSALISLSQDHSYKWTEEVTPGNGSFSETWIPGKWPMGIIPLVAFNDQLYMIGQNTTWISKDGITWTAFPKTDWGARYGMTFTFFNGKLWMMGGMKTWDKFCNDIWSSQDGKKWKQVKMQADWSARRGHSVIVFNNKLWLFGGSVSTGQPDKPPTKSLNDIWSTVDGENWTNVSSESKWNARDPQVTVFGNKLYLVGDFNKTDVWSSPDGKEWTMLADKTSWNARQNYGLLVFDEKLWIFGGREHNDVWYSTNGKNWIRQTSAAPWSKRTAYHSVVYLNKLWIYSGKTGREDSWSGDVWTMTKSMQETKAVAGRKKYF